MLSKILTFIKLHQADIVLAISMILLTFVAFQIGKISGINSFKTPIEIEDRGVGIIKNTSQANSPGHPIEEINMPVVASKNSNKYHFPWCAGASRISPNNKITFKNEGEAIKAGYILAGNCRK